MTAALHDSVTMIRRDLRHAAKSPAVVAILIGIPIVFLLLFVYVFGEALGTGIGGLPDTGRQQYLNYVTPGVLLLSAVGAATSTAVAVATDMTKGIIDRFRTMPIFGPSVLVGHVVGSVVKTMLSIGCVILVALLMGFEPTASLPEWAAAAGLLALVVFATTWLAVALGLVADSPDSASNLPLPLMLLPFIGSGFMPAESLPAWLASFARNQPFTAVTEAVRGLLLGGPVADDAVRAVVSCSAVTLGCFAWAVRLYGRRTQR